MLPASGEQIGAAFHVLIAQPDRNVTSSSHQTLHPAAQRPIAQVMHCGQRALQLRYYIFQLMRMLRLQDAVLEHINIMKQLIKHERGWGIWLIYDQSQ